MTCDRAILLTIGVQFFILLMASGALAFINYLGPIQAVAEYAGGGISVVLLGTAALFIVLYFSFHYHIEKLFKMFGTLALLLLTIPAMVYVGKNNNRVAVLPASTDLDVKRLATIEQSSAATQLKLAEVQTNLTDLAAKQLSRQQLVASIAEVMGSKESLVERLVKIEKLSTASQSKLAEVQAELIDLKTKQITQQQLAEFQKEIETSKTAISSLALQIKNNKAPSWVFDGPQYTMKWPNGVNVMSMEEEKHLSVLEKLVAKLPPGEQAKALLEIKNLREQLKSKEAAYKVGPKGFSLTQPADKDGAGIEVEIPPR